LLLAGLAVEPLRGSADKVLEADHSILAILVRKAIAQSLHDLGWAVVTMVVVITAVRVSIRRFACPVGVRKRSADVAE
jgi:hypothetical protein